MPPKDKYTDPKLRQEVKEEVQGGDKGGAPGQWSARKAQMMASEYKKRGGGYTTDKKDESQKHLSKWGEEDWQTKEGSGDAKQADGTEKRYLPKKAWENMSEEEKKATEEKKLKGSEEGKQYVGNTKEAREARKDAAKDEGQDDKGEIDDGGNGDPEAESESKQDSGSPEEQEDEEYEDEEGEDEAEDEDEKNASGEKLKPKGQKRKADAGDEKGDKKQKANSGDSKSRKSSDTVGSKHDPAEAPAPAGSATRLPKVGQRVQWRALPGYVSGEVVELAYEEKEVQGKKVKASKKDPRIILESDNGKIAVHKPETCFFEDE